MLLCCYVITKHSSPQGGSILTPKLIPKRFAEDGQQISIHLLILISCTSTLLQAKPSGIDIRYSPAIMLFCRHAVFKTVKKAKKAKEVKEVKM